MQPQDPLAAIKWPDTKPTAQEQEAAEFVGPAVVEDTVQQIGPSEEAAGDTKSAKESASKAAIKSKIGSNKVKGLVIVGAILAVFGLMLAFTANMWLGILLMLMGAGLVFLAIRPPKK